MDPEYRQRLLCLLSKLDQLQSGAESILANPVAKSIAPRAEELRSLIIEMHAMIDRN
jgi:hypothetical protein